MNTCQFHPTHAFGVTCDSPAQRQVFVLGDNNDGDGYYLYICDECLPIAVEYWKEGGFKVEF
jgi:hypothetical protein